MKFSLNGANSLAQQTLDLQNAEVLRYKLLGIVPELDSAPNNIAELQPLKATDPTPAPLTLHVAGTPPPGKIIFWMGTLYVSGGTIAAIAVR